MPDHRGRAAGCDVRGDDDRLREVVACYIYDGWLNAHADTRYHDLWWTDHRQRLHIAPSHHKLGGEPARRGRVAGIANIPPGGIRVPANDLRLPSQKQRSNDGIGGRWSKTTVDRLIFRRG